MKVIIMRGIPGSGKSTWIKDNYSRTSHSVSISSADKFFMKEDEWGTMHYRFDPTRIREAHDYCLKDFLDCLKNARNYAVNRAVVIVDNTNTKVFEIAPYYRLAEAFGAEAEIVWCQCNPATAIKRGVHGVPENKVWEMWKSFEALPPWWNVRYVNTDEKESR